jgi:hypothetical protein
MKPRILRRVTAALALLAGLSGCASVYRVDNQVESFARWDPTARPAGSTAAVPTPPQRYRFERLPSQATGPAEQSQDALERLAQAVMSPLGWTLAEATEKVSWTVQVAGQNARLPYAPWESPWGGDRYRWFGQMHMGVGVGSARVMWSPWLLRSEMPYYQRQVSLVIRESGSGRVAYETHAAHDGVWNSTPDLWKAMLSAALTDFPNPPTGVRQVNLDVPR